MPTRVLSDSEIMKRVATHEAGHAVAYIVAFRAMGQHWPAFHRVFIRDRQEWSTPYIDERDREVHCVGLLEAPDIYTPLGKFIVGKLIADSEHDPLIWQKIISRMEWAIIGCLAGPMAEARFLGASKSNMRYAALHCGGSEDYGHAEGIIFADYRHATKCRHGLRRFEDRTVTLVLNDWRAIDALAEALVTKRAIEYDEAVQIVAPLLSSE